MLRLVLLGILGLGCLAADETPCTLHDSGKYFDLNPLKSRYVRYAVMERQDSHNCLSSKDYEFQTPGGHTLTINACRSPVREPFGLRDVNEKDIGGFVRHDHGDFSIGCV
jgi:cation-dependent mannose-6-phosphate receptor